MIKMTGITYFFGAAFAAAIAMGGCSSSSSSPSPAGSAEGESCGRTSDCASNLVCIAQTCVAKGTPVIGADGGVIIQPGSDGGPIIAPATDSGTLVDAAPPRTSARGESCFGTADCATGLVCIPYSLYGGAGTCDVQSYGLTPTGKSCTGECNTAADCCQLPVFSPAITLNSPASVAIPIHSCSDILNGVLAGNTTQCSASPAAGTPVNEGCFLYQTYCQCAANTWACNKNTCSYTAACANATAYSLGGCPAQARINASLVTTCTAGACAAATVVGGCTADSDCDTKPTADTGYTCRAGDCACSNKACYLKCNTELDCGEGYSCNTTSHLCTENGSCTTDADCALPSGNILSKCVTGTCRSKCTTDRDCSPSGAVHTYPNSSFNGTVCGTDGFCSVDLGCASDADCADTNQGQSLYIPHHLCVTAPPTTTTTPPHSAFKN